jgi:hypothetical protein
MSGHTMSRSTQTLEMTQLVEINERLLADDPYRSECLLLTAEYLGLTGIVVRPTRVDRPAAALIPRQRHGDDGVPLPASAQLLRLLAAGAPNYPYLYGAFGEPNGADRELPVLLHTEHLRMISRALRLRRHQWGV